MTRSPVTSSAAPLGLLALYLLEQWRGSPHGLIFLAEEERRGEQLGAILYALDPGCGTMLLPRADNLPYDGMEPSSEVSGRRASVLRRLAEHSRPCLLIATAEAMIQCVPDRAAWASATMHLRKGGCSGVDELRNFLVGAGYVLEDRLEMPGSAVLLGQVVEIYPAGALAPVRVSISDGRIIGIATYSLENQREIEDLVELTLDAVSEFAECVAQPAGSAEADCRKPQHSNTSPFDYVPSARLIADFGTMSRAVGWIQLIDEARQEAGSPSGREFFLSKTDWETKLARRDLSVLPKSSPFEEVPNFAGTASPSRSLRAFLKEQETLGRRIVFTAASEADLRTMDRRAGSVSERCADWREATRGKAASRRSLVVNFDRGFIRSGKHAVAVVTAADLMGSRAAQQNPMARDRSALPDDGAVMRPGHVVVHLDRGLAILRGLETISAPDVPDSEMVRLEFKNRETILVPFDELRSVWPYSSDSEGVALDSADGSSWQERRQQMELDIAETAGHLAQLASERSMREVAKIIPPPLEYERFAARFGYSATADQSRAIEEVLEDLASGRPMDRLVCGDVGYGKTEVALRAAAAVVFAGGQVAVAVPTTILCRQHVATFQRRFAPFGVQVRELSRFTKAAEARASRKSLADGSLRLVVGTHALLAKGIRFGNLQLLVIDEEQRYGSADKKKLAALGKNVHVLTMTATPIPRTLSFASAGIRSISSISTPPVRRIPVKSVVEPFNDAMVAAALRREQRRRGQSFLVCPRIEDIDPMENRLRSIVPELRVIKVHGKMPAQEIEESMFGFSTQKADLLLTTNIIENGLDLPRANTIIVWRPDKFGLAQLHQLRGRVGRSGTRAFAYFVYDPNVPLSTAATKRLGFLQEASRLGAGLEISAKDLALRGSGDLLSERQSGHVKALGAALYRHFLQRAICRLNDGCAEDQVRPLLRLGISFLLPKTYVENDGARLEIYARLSKCGTQRELDDIEDELEERFGELPAQARALVEVARIEIECRRLGIVQVDAGREAVAATLRHPAQFASSKSSRIGRKLYWKEGRLIYPRPNKPSERLNVVRELIELWSRASKAAS